MTQNNNGAVAFDAVVERLHVDPGFRARFLREPFPVLSECGLSKKEVASLTEPSVLKHVAGLDGRSEVSRDWELRYAPSKPQV